MQRKGSDGLVRRQLVSQAWDLEADVVVIGFGAAGACAALEASAGGAEVIVLDRFCGGGATALSGGVVYAGGGTVQQLQAGVRDTPEAMFGYLSHEVGEQHRAVRAREYPREVGHKQPGQRTWGRAFCHDCGSLSVR